MWDMTKDRPTVTTLVDAGEPLHAVAVRRERPDGGGRRRARCRAGLRDRRRVGHRVGGARRASPRPDLPSGRSTRQRRDDGTLRLWDVDTGAIETVETGSPITDVAVSGNGDLVASSGSDGIVRVWTPDDLSDPVGQTAAVAAGTNSVAFSGTREVVAAYGDGRVRFWNRDGSEAAATRSPSIPTATPCSALQSAPVRTCSPRRAQPMA